jgi:hypothetical protein
MLVVARLAERVIAEHLDHAALGDASAGALFDHALLLALERLQPGDALLDRGELRPGDGVDGRA